MLKVWPAAVIVASRADPGFGSTVNGTVPFPVPLKPAVKCTHDCDAEADQLHALPALTLNEPEPPPELNDWLAGVMLNAHPSP